MTRGAAPPDLLSLTAELVDIPSVSHQEGALVDHLAARLAAVPGLALHRIGDNLVARTELGRERRLVLAGHTDTVPPDGNDRARQEGDVLWGVGSADMKSGLAVLCALAAGAPEPAIDVTYVFYVAEEVESRFNGLGHLFESCPDLVDGDAAVLLEPTGALVEAGCQGTLRVAVTLTGTRAHTARAWMGSNAIHRLGPLLSALESYSPRVVVIDGCEYREGLQAVRIDGGVAGNVVPDAAVVTLNHRFAPDRTVEDALQHLRAVLSETGVGDADDFEVLDAVSGARPALDHPMLAALLARSGRPPRAKLGWTDVARFAAQGIPAVNYGPGDPTLIHSAAERVERHEIESVHEVLAGLLANGD